MLSNEDGLPVVCTGSVFKSWHLIKPGFIRCLESQITKCSRLNEMNLVMINGDSSIGAAILASKIFDPSLDLLKYFDRRKLITKLDHFHIKQIKMKSHNYTQQNVFKNSLNMDNLIAKEA